MPKAKPTQITDVARVAGVSTTTVSRVINGIDTVNPENRQKVLQAIKMLKYRPNPNAQRLAGAKTNTVGLIVPRYEGIFHSYFALQVIKGIGAASERVRCDLLLHITDGKTVPIRSSVDGFIFLDVYGCEELLDNVLNEGIPAVVLNHRLDELPVSYVAVDNALAAKRVVDYLVGLGHKEIATITGDLKTQAGLDRLGGFLKALEDRQMLVREGYIQVADFGLPSARSAMESLLGLHDRPTAVFIASDDMALEAIQVALAKGIRIPEELSVVGFDDNPIAAHGRVPLTTVRQPLEEMGHRALDILVQQLAGKRAHPTRLLLTTELVERASTRQTWIEAH